MTKNTLKMVLILGLLAVLIVSVAGCTSSTSSSNTSTGNSQNLALAYANAILQPANLGLGTNGTLTGSNAFANGSDGAQLTATIKNTTPDGLWTNGTITTMALNVQHFSSVDEATAFYNNQSFGYTAGLNTTINGTSVYEQVMGHAPSVSTGSYKLASFNFASAQMDLAMQQGEFVMWGQVSVTGL